MTAPSITHIFQDNSERLNRKLNVNFSDLVNYLSERNDGTTTWDRVLITNAVSVPLVVNNSTGTQNIANFQDNGSNVFTIADGGLVAVLGHLGVGDTPVVGHLIDVYGDSAGGNSPGISISNTAEPFAGETYLAQFGKTDDNTLHKMAVVHAGWVDDDATSGYAYECMHAAYMNAGVQTDDHFIRGFGNKGCTIFWDSQAAPGLDILQVNGQVDITNTSNQLVLGATRTVTLTAPTPATASRTHTVPDISGNGTFSFLEGTQTFSGAKTFSSAINLTSGQITFPAAQSASADANTLDDYEEGSFEVAFASSTGTITIDASNKTGYYTKIGNTVTVTGSFLVDSVSSPTGNFSITGLPFTCARQAACSVWVDGLAAGATDAIQGHILASTTVVRVSKYSAGADGQLAGDIQAGSTIEVMGVYYV